MEKIRVIHSTSRIKNKFEVKFSVVIKTKETICRFRKFHETLVALYTEYTNSVIFPCLIP